MSREKRKIPGWLLILAGFVFTVVIFIVLAFGLIHWFKYLDWSESHYRNMRAARADTEVGGGWIPEWLPESTRDIHEIHNIDTNQIWISFKFERDDFLEAIESANVQSFSSLRLDEGPRRHKVSWWPDRDDPALTADDADWRYYKGHGRIQMLIGGNYVYFVAADLSRGVAYYWERPSWF